MSVAVENFTAIENYNQQNDKEHKSHAFNKKSEIMKNI